MTFLYGQIYNQHQMFLLKLSGVLHCWMSWLQLKLAPFSCICSPPIFRADNVQALFMAAPSFPYLDSIYEWILPELTKIAKIWQVLRFMQCKWCGWEKWYNKHCLWDRWKILLALYFTVLFSMYTLCICYSNYNN